MRYIYDSNEQGVAATPEPETEEEYRAIQRARFQGASFTVSSDGPEPHDEPRPYPASGLQFEDTAA